MASIGINVFPLRPDQVMGLWPLVEPFITIALEHSENELEAIDICQKSMQGEMQIWMIARLDKLQGIGVTEVITFPKLTSLRVVTLSGEHFREWKEELDKQLEKFARIVKADRIEAVGRKGWTRELCNLGYKQAYVIVTRSLSPEAESKEALHEQIRRDD